jgi:hypothetical protein
LALAFKEGRCLYSRNRVGVKLGSDDESS